MTSSPDLFYPLRLAPDEFWANVRADGGDIRVMSEYGEPIARQVVAFDRGAQTGALFLKPTSAKKYYVLFGNASLTEPLETSPIGSGSVWGSSASIVLHGGNLLDSTANSNDGTAYNIADHAAAHGVSIVSGGGPLELGAIQTSQYDDIVEVPHSASLVFPTAITMVLWSKITHFYGVPGFPRQECEWIRKGWFYNFPYYWGLQFNTDDWGGLCCTIQPGANPQFPGDTNGENGHPWMGFGSVALNAWTMVAASINSSHEMYQYANGVKINNTPFMLSYGPENIPSEKLDHTPVNLQLFDRNEAPREPATGQFAEIRIYRRILSDDEIRDLYRNHATPESVWTTGGVVDT